VTSGSYAPFLKKNIAAGVCAHRQSEIGHEVCVQCRATPVKCKVVPSRFTSDEEAVVAEPEGRSN